MNFRVSGLIFRKIIFGYTKTHMDRNPVYIIIDSTQTSIFPSTIYWHAAIAG